MSASLKHEQGFSLPEVLLSLMLLVMVVSALAGYQKNLAVGAAELQQYRQLWRYASEQTLPQVDALPAGWRQTRMQTSRQSCVSITVTIATPTGRQGQMSRLHCPRIHED
ncbi:prepilin-type N-terminal cleavage/methylation domain-containing protein [Pluralibacter sp.]|uniref:prepilin-type N-terminal cleavage/methylation domain-containing protein n=1 Tax=Pluralibacter sp. TaxID=1920032 RepID=UPI0025FAD988|nr:prepilin-type N-terminal cleavage/methylation domain-containing protein [Pluralibacter sp.]MBV8041204.1 prepilin-type N-terminal cleavage/methylation domain-containing protein [Pluralibacter sp.]